MSMYWKYSYQNKYKAYLPFNFPNSDDKTIKLSTQDKTLEWLKINQIK